MKKILFVCFSIIVILFCFYALPVNATDITNVDSENSSMKMYLIMDGIEGSCEEEEHKNWIELINFSHGSTEVRGKDETMKFSHSIDVKATPKIQEACMKGTIINNATCAVCKNVDGQYKTMYKINMKNIKITDVIIEREYDDVSTLVENVIIQCEKLSWEDLQNSDSNRFRWSSSSKLCK